MKLFRIAGCFLLGFLSGCGAREMSARPAPPQSAAPPSTASSAPPAPTTTAAFGSIRGIVKDSSGAAVAHATAYAEGQGLTRSVETNQSGQYLFTGLPAGQYTIKLVSAGFGETTLGGVKVAPGAAAQRNVVLHPEVVGASADDALDADQAGPPPPPPPFIPSFPIHPPVATSRDVLPPLQMSNGKPARTLGDIDRILSDALYRTGYGAKGYYSYPDGFALATRMEQIYPDGRSMPPPARFQYSPAPPPFWSLQTIESVFVPRQGYFRVIVFIVTDLPITESSTPTTETVASNWTSAGADSLPVQVASTPVSQGIKVTAFIYEFEDSTADDVNQFSLLDAASITPPAQLLDTQQQLVGAGLWKALRLP